MCRIVCVAARGEEGEGQGTVGTWRRLPPERPAHRWRLTRLQPWPWAAGGTPVRGGSRVSEGCRPWWRTDGLTGGISTTLCETSSEGGVKLSRGRWKQTRDGNVGRPGPGDPVFPAGLRHQTCPRRPAPQSGDQGPRVCSRWRLTAPTSHPPPPLLLSHGWMSTTLGLFLRLLTLSLPPPSPPAPGQAWSPLKAGP